MDFIQHTINWAKGEILEAIIMGIFGIIVVLSSVLLWKFGITPYAKALVVPLFVVGSIPVIMGVVGVISNKNRISVYQNAWQQNQHNFLKAEKERVEGFDEIFKYTYPMAIILVVGGAILFFVLKTPTWKGMSLAMMVMGLMTYFIDHFAAERAALYLEHINTYIKA